VAGGPQLHLEFPVGILNGGLYLVVFKQARLYSDAGLQLAFIALLVYGWLKWVRSADAPDAPTLPITHTPQRVAGGLAAAGLLFAVGAGFLFHCYTDAPCRTGIALPRPSAWRLKFCLRAATSKTGCCG
jgi:nicotinamide riboside transporter PnuC